MAMWTETVSTKEWREVVSVDPPSSFDVVARVFKDSTKEGFRYISDKLALISALALIDCERYTHVRLGHVGPPFLPDFIPWRRTSILLQTRWLQHFLVGFVSSGHRSLFVSLVIGFKCLWYILELRIDG